MGVPELHVSDRPKPHRKAGRFARKADDLSDAALNSRCLRFGIAPGEAARKAMRGTEAGSPIGMVMLRMCASADEVARLWAVWQGFCAAEQSYRLRYLGQSGNPKGASIVMVPDHVEADKHHTIDARTNDQKDRDAVDNWMRWRGYLGHLDRMMQGALHCAERGERPDLWEDRAPTEAGIFALTAVRALSAIVERKKSAA